jgi:hypothetical protein
VFIPGDTCRLPLVLVATALGGVSASSALTSNTAATFLPTAPRSESGVRSGSYPLKATTKPSFKVVGQLGAGVTAAGTGC